MPHNEESKEAQFIETIRDCYLYQHLSEPTRSRSTDNPSLVLTNKVMKVSDIEYHAPLGKSDHCVITFKFHCYLDYSHMSIIKLILIRWEDNLYYQTGKKDS